VPAAVASQTRIRHHFSSQLHPQYCRSRRKTMPPAPHVQYVYTRLQLANSQLPPSDWGRLLAHSYAEHGNWYVMMVLDAYQMAGSGNLLDKSLQPWDYDAMCRWPSMARLLCRRVS